MYAGLAIVFFFLVLFLQQIGGYSPLNSGLATLPATVMMFFLSRRFGALADRFGPRFFMGVGPLVAAVGLLLFQTTGLKADYVSEVLPPLLIFSLGLSMTVAPLTAAVLAGVEDEHAGVASGVNNAVARVAGLLAIAAVGALVSAQYGSTLDDRLAGQRLDAPGRAAVAGLRARPLAVAHDDPLLRDATEDASVDAFRTGMLAAGLLAMLGGAVSAAGIENPRRRAAARCPGGALVGASRELEHARS
jgi:MFS family permease